MIFGVLNRKTGILLLKKPKVQFDLGSWLQTKKKDAKLDGNSANGKFDSASAGGPAVAERLKQRHLL